MREDYDFLTDATEAVLTRAGVKMFAAAWGKCKSFVYGILDGTHRDPYAYFRSAYLAGCEIGATAAWDNDMAMLRQSHAPHTRPADVTIERRKLHKERMEFDLAELENKPIGDQVRELEEYVAAATRLLEAKRAELVKGEGERVRGSE